MAEIVYILSNPSIQKKLKIGKTDREDVSIRMRELWTTSVSTPFDCVYACIVGDNEAVEKTHAQEIRQAQDASKQGISQNPLHEYPPPEILSFLFGIKKSRLLYVILSLASFIYTTFMPYRLIQFAALQCMMTEVLTSSRQIKKRFARFTRNTPT
jgi:hypothetical protein